MTSDRRSLLSRVPLRALRRLVAGMCREPGRKLRVLAGVDEQILAWVPSERARYTALGGVVLGTAVIAGLSMWNALSAVMGGGQFVLLLPVLIWMLFILNLDRWLVSSSAGVQWRRRAAVLLPRLVISFFFGFIIAEPLVLQIFHTAVVQHIEEERADQLDALRTELVACNPAPGEDSLSAAAREKCAGRFLNFGDTPVGVANQLESLRADVRAQDRLVTRETRELDELNELARKECAGSSGAGFTGRRGEGPNCRRLRQEADEYTAGHPIAEHNTRLDQLRLQVAGLETEVRSGTESFERIRAEQIDERLAETASHHGPIGMLERLRALDELTGSNPFLFVASWLVRVFFILVDCLPVLVKFFAGATAYDRQVDEKVTSAGRVFARTVRTGERKQVLELELDEYAAGLDAAKRRESLDLDARRHAATVEVDLDRQVEDLAQTIHARSRGDDASLPTSRPEAGQTAREPNATAGSGLRNNRIFRPRHTASEADQPTNGTHI